jgi:hypothetical protein
VARGTGPTAKPSGSETYRDGSHCFCSDGSASIDRCLRRKEVDILRLVEWCRDIKISRNLSLRAVRNSFNWGVSQKNCGPKFRALRVTTGGAEALGEQGRAKAHAENVRTPPAPRQRGASVTELEHRGFLQARNNILFRSRTEPHVYVCSPEISRATRSHRDSQSRTQLEHGSAFLTAQAPSCWAC